MSTYYVTTYALTDKIWSVEGEICERVSNDMISYIAPNGLKAYCHGKNKNWHETHESAVKKAESMRVKKIASLKRQIAKLEVLSF